SPSAPRPAQAGPLNLDLRAVAVGLVIAVTHPGDVVAAVEQVAQAGQAHRRPDPQARVAIRQTGPGDEAARPLAVARLRQAARLLARQRDGVDNPFLARRERLLQDARSADVAVQFSADRAGVPSLLDRLLGRHVPAAHPDLAALVRQIGADAEGDQPGSVAQLHRLAVALWPRLCV